MRRQTRRWNGSNVPAIRSCASSGRDRYALGAEFFRWEFATAVAGAVLGVNPFDQPDVEAAKVVTRRLAAEYEQTGTLSDDEPPLQEQAIKALLDQLREGDYFALLAFIEMSEAHRNALDAIRGIVRDRWQGRDDRGLRSSVPAFDRAGA